MVAPLDLMDILDVTYPRLQDFVSAVSVACAPSAKNVRDNISTLVSCKPCTP